MILKSFLEKFLLLFRPEPFRELARASFWSKRKGKIDPFDFLISLLFGQMSALRLTLDSQAQSLEEPVSRQAIDQRYTPAAVAFLKAAFDHVLVQTLAWSVGRSQRKRCENTSVPFICSTALALIVQTVSRIAFPPAEALARPPT